MKIFFEFRKLEFFEGIENFEFSFLKILLILNFWRNLKKFDWWNFFLLVFFFFLFFECGVRSTSPMPLVPRPFLKISFFFYFYFYFYFLFFLKILEILNFFMELKFLIDDFFFFWKIWKSWVFSRNWKFWIFFFEKFGNLEFLKEFEKIWLMKFFFFLESGLRSTSPMALVPRPFLKFSFFFFFERFRKNWFFFFSEIWRFVHYQKVKKMKME